MGCAECHVPMMVLEDQFFREPNPFNPPGNLSNTNEEFAFDMTIEGELPRLEPNPGGGGCCEFTDLKRHNLNDNDYNFFANELLPQGLLNGFAPASDFHHRGLTTSDRGIFRRENSGMPATANRTVIAATWQ